MRTAKCLARRTEEKKLVLWWTILVQELSLRHFCYSYELEFSLCVLSVKGLPYF